MSDKLTVDISSLRMKYKEKKEVLLESSILVKEPISLFRKWLNEATSTEEILEPNAACLATVDSEGRPANRYVLLKDVNDDGFTFFTNYGSKKAKDIEGNPNVAMTLYWCPLRKSIRIEGVAEKISHQESLDYWKQRPRASRIGALSSPQSQIIPSRQYLDETEKKIKDDLGDNPEIPMPNWGGYIIRPRLVEFWQGQTDRLHDRIRFRKDDKCQAEVDNKLTHMGENGWVYERLAP